MSGAPFPPQYRLERLAKSHTRKAFASGQAQVDDWLRTKALQHQEKRLSVTQVLLDDAKAFYRQFDFAELPGHPYRLFLTSAQLRAMMSTGGTAGE